MGCHPLRIVMTAAVLACVMSAVSLAASSPIALLVRIFAAARAQHSVHYVSTAQLGTTRVVQVSDVATAKGIQRISYTKSGTTGHVTVIVFGHSAYVRGDAFALVNFMGFNPAASAKSANDWVLIPRGDRDYANVAGDVTLPSAIGSLKGPGRPMAAPSATIGDQRVVGVQWRALVGGKRVVIKLYARASGTPLPVEQRATRGNAVISVTLSGWNEAIGIRAPTAAVPIATTGLE